MPEQVPPGEANKYDDIVMPEQHRHLANKYEDIVNLQRGGGILCRHAHSLSFNFTHIRIVIQLGLGRLKPRNTEYVFRN